MVKKGKSRDIYMSIPKLSFFDPIHSISAYVFLLQHLCSLPLLRAAPYIRGKLLDVCRVLNFNFNYFLNRPQALRTSASYHVCSVLVKLKNISDMKDKIVLNKEIRRLCSF